MKRKHHDAIVAWAGGAEIQHRAPGSSEWKDNADPAWVTDYEYRVKPAREYPKTTLPEDSIISAWYGGGPVNGAKAEVFAMFRVANEAIRHAIDNGQVVTREEFDRAIGDRRKRDSAIGSAFIDYFCYSLGRSNLPVPSPADFSGIIDKVKA